MVDLMFWPDAMNVEPSEAVCEMDDAINANGYVVVTEGSGDRTSFLSTSSREPHEPTHLRVVIQDLEQTRVGERIDSSHDAFARRVVRGWVALPTLIQPRHYAGSP